MLSSHVFQAVVKGSHPTVNFRGSGSHLWDSPSGGLALRAISSVVMTTFLILATGFSWFAWEADTKVWEADAEK